MQGDIHIHAPGVRISLLHSAKQQASSVFCCVFSCKIGEIRSRHPARLLAGRKSSSSCRSIWFSWQLFLQERLSPTTKYLLTWCHHGILPKLCQKYRVGLNTSCCTCTGGTLWCCLCSRHAGECKSGWQLSGLLWFHCVDVLPNQAGVFSGGVVCGVLALPRGEGGQVSFYKTGHKWRWQNMGDTLLGFNYEH